MTVNAQVTTNYPVNIYLEEELASASLSKRFREIVGYCQIDLEQLHLYQEEVLQNDVTQKVHFFNLRWLSKTKIKESVVDLPNKIIFEEVFALLCFDALPRFTMNKNCSWVFEDIMSVREILSESEFIQEKLYLVYKKLSARKFFVFPLNPKRDYWERRQENSLGNELQYFTIRELHVQLERAAEAQLSLYDVAKIPRTIRKMVIALGGWDSKRGKWRYSGCFASKINDFSGLNQFLVLEEIALHHFYQINAKTLRKYFLDFQKLRQISLMNCKVDPRDFTSVMQKYLPKVKLLVDNYF